MVRPVLPDLTGLQQIQSKRFFSSPEREIMFESAVRKFIKRTFGDDATWIEQSRGSTFGFPDCILTMDIFAEIPPFLVPAELKRATIENGHIKENVTKLFRAEQLAHIFRTVRKRTISLVIFGQLDTELPEIFAISSNFTMMLEIMGRKPISCKEISSKSDILKFSHDLITSRSRNLLDLKAHFK